MAGVVGVGEDAAVHLRVQCHDSVAQDGGHAGQFGHVGDRYAGGGDGRRGAAARHQPPAEAVEAGRQLGHACLVEHREQGGACSHRRRTLTGTHPKGRVPETGPLPQ